MPSRLKSPADPPQHPTLQNIFPPGPSNSPLPLAVSPPTTAPPSPAAPCSGYFSPLPRLPFFTVLFVTNLLRNPPAFTRHSSSSSYKPAIKTALCTLPDPSLLSYPSCSCFSPEFKINHTGPIHNVYVCLSSILDQSRLLYFNSVPLFRFLPSIFHLQPTPLPDETST